MANSVGRNTMKASDLRGVSIYQEKKRTVYYDVLNKNGYIINNAEVKNYMLFSNRHTAIALGAVVIYYLTNNVVLSVWKERPLSWEAAMDMPLYSAMRTLRMTQNQIISVR